MSDCRTCVHATWDFEEYYGGYRRYFVDGCLKDRYPDECNDYEEERKAD